MTDQIKGRIDAIDGWGHPVLQTGVNELGRPIVEPLTSQRTFTRSDGTVVARLYERLTKRSRRREPDKEAGWYSPTEQAYRLGVYDAYKHLQKELDYLV